MKKSLNVLMIEMLKYEDEQEKVKIASPTDSIPSRYLSI